LQEQIISLAFNKNKQKLKQIVRKISQELLVSLILFLIYIRFLFLQIRARYNVSISSYIDNVTIYIEERKVAKNATILQRVIKIAF